MLQLNSLLRPFQKIAFLISNLISENGGHFLCQKCYFFTFCKFTEFKKEVSFSMDQSLTIFPVFEISCCFLKNNEPFPPLFHLFLYSQTNSITIFTTNKCEKCPSRAWCWDSNLQPSEHECPPITTRPRLLPPPPQRYILLTKPDNKYLSANGKWGLLLHFLLRLNLLSI